MKSKKHVAINLMYLVVSRPKWMEKTQKCNSRIAELNEKKDQFLEDKKNKKREKDCTEIIKKVEKVFRLACEKPEKK